MQFSTIVLFASAAIAVTTTSTSVVKDNTTTTLSIINCGSGVSHCPGSSTTAHPTTAVAPFVNATNSTRPAVSQFTGAANGLYPAAAAVAAGVVFLL